MKKRKNIFVSIIAAALLMLTVGVLFMEINYKTENNMTENTSSLDNSKNNTPDSGTADEADAYIEPASVSIVAVGDDLISTSVLATCKISDGNYDFSSVFADTKSEIEAADLAVINQETILGGSEYEYSGYPNFNSPDILGDEIINTGFDVVLHATNHSRDVYVEGIYNCISYWEQHPEILMIGLNKSEDDYNTVPVIVKNGITFAVLNYTYGLNGYTLPEEEFYLVNLIDEDKIRSDIETAEKIADFTIVFPHWGVEYAIDENDEQYALAEMMTEAGADLIIGTHPHVLEPIKWIESENGNRSLCYFSLGNFTSGQQKTETVLGGMAKLTVKKDETGAYIDDAGIIPLVTHYVWGTSDRVIRTYKLSDYTTDLASQHSICDYDNTFSCSRLNELANEIVGDWILE